MKKNQRFYLFSALFIGLLLLFFVGNVDALSRTSTTILGDYGVRFIMAPNRTLGWLIADVADYYRFTFTPGNTNFQQQRYESGYGWGTWQTVHGGFLHEQLNRVFVCDGGNTWLFSFSANPPTTEANVLEFDHTSDFLSCYLDSSTISGSNAGRIWFSTSQAINYLHRVGSTWTLQSSFFTFPTANAPMPKSGDLDVVGRKMYVGTRFGKIAIVDIDDVGNLATKTKLLTACAGDVTQVKMFSQDGSSRSKTHAWIASSSSMISKWSIINERIDSIFLYANPTGSQDSIINLEYDQTAQVLFVVSRTGSRNANIFRIEENGADIVLMDQIGVTETYDFEILPDSLLLDPTASRLYVVNSLFRLITFSITDCSSRSCLNCLQTDPKYCGFCAVDAACTDGLSCSETRLQNIGSCPRTVGIFPAAGAIDGGTSVAVQGTSFVANRIADYQCRFNTTAPFAPTSINSTHIVCASPPRATPGAASLSILYKGQVWNDGVDYRYYSCNRECGSCFEEAECGWCLRSSNCSSNRQCAASDFDRSCPVVTGVSPISAETTISSNVVVSVSRALPSTPYECRFGAGSVPAVSVSAGSPGAITCPSPTTGIAPGFVDIGVAIQASAASYTTNNGTFEFYNCAPANPCFQCVADSRPNCVFCSSSLACTRSTNASFCSTSPSRACPLLNRVFPRSASVADLTGRNITLIGELPAVASMSCYWPGNVQTPATSLNATHITCPFPANPAVGDILVSIYSGNIPYSNPLPFRFYDCSILSSCSSCLDPLHTECVYCTDGASLKCSRSASAALGCPSSPTISAGSACPAILSVTPDNGARDGGMTVNITLSSAPSSALTIDCRFAGSASYQTNASLEGTTVTCLTPALPSAGNTSVQVIVNSKPYTPLAFINIYDCAISDAGSKIDSCETCLQSSRPQCTWCSASACTSVLACTSGVITECPALLGVSPASGSADGGERVFVAARSLPTNLAGITLQCQFDDRTVPAVVTVGGVFCTTPAAAAVGPVPLRILLNGAPFAPETLSFRYFRCNTGLPSCLPACFSDPDCGWCVANQLCISRGQCSRVRPVGLLADPIWLNGTCLSATVVPNHLQVGESYGSETKITFVIPALSAAVPLPLSKKRSTPDDSSLYRCVFDITGNKTTNVTGITSDSVSCNLPFTTATSTSVARILYQGQDLVTPSSFTFIDCLAESRCGRCILSPICGWCLESSSCTTALSCNSTGKSFSKEECPSFRSVSPQLGLNTGGASVTITGSLFVNSSNWFVLVDNTTKVPATWVSQSALSFSTPVLTGKVGPVNLTLFLGEEAYSDETVVFTLQDPPSGVTSTTNFALGAGLGAGLGILALIAAIVIAIIIVRRRRDNSIRLKEPDYAVVAYGDFLAPKFKMPKDNLDILAIKLLDKSHGLLLSIELGTSPTESDLVAKALTFLYSSYPGKAEEAIQALVAGEISRTKQETTLFRQNSMSSKMFKFYSKVVGIRYLFKTLARFIAEINHLALEASAGRSAKAGESLLTVDIEIDNDKMKPSEADQDLMREANVMQLNLTCQKVFNACRTNLNVMPVEFKRIFRQMQWQILAKWSDMEIVFKAVGGFLYLRFLCPAITAPHAYGLLENPPNESAQRQLVLIGKVIQNLANLQPPGAKESYMLALNSFYDKNLDRMRDFYKELLRDDVIEGETDDAPVVTQAVKDNSLGTIWNHILVYKGKIEGSANNMADDDVKASALGALTELTQTYGEKKLSQAKDKEKTESK